MFFRTVAANSWVTPTRLIPSTSTIWSFTCMLDRQKTVERKGDFSKQRFHTELKYFPLSIEEPQVQAHENSQHFCLLLCNTCSIKLTRLQLAIKFRSVNFCRRILKCGWGLKKKSRFGCFDSPSVLLSCAALCDGFHKNTKFLQALVGSHSHSYDADAKAVVSWTNRK